ncbi:MAG TPA: TetR/AcrR family transcriptional regulator [Gemmatimonadaceae bacterium]
MPPRTATPQSSPRVEPALRDQSLRAQTLDAARRLIARHGHRDVSMRDIAAEVGCSVSSLYLYFANRDALIHTLIDEGFQRWYGEQLALVEQHGDPWTRLEAIARRYVEFGLANPELYEIMYMFHPQSMRRIPKDLFRRIRRSLDLTTENILACVGADVMGESEARVVAASVWATLHGVVSTILTQRLDTRIDQRRYIDRAVRSVRAAVAAARD